MDSEGERKQTSQNEKNSRRRKKTPSQLEMLEKIFAEEKYPSESVRGELSAKLGLSDRQLQMWFCHRRLKDRKGKEDESLASAAAAVATVTAKQPKKEKPVGPREYLASVPTSEVMDSGLIAGNYYDDDLSAAISGFAHEEGAPHSRKGSGKREVKDAESPPRKKSRQTAFKGVDPRRAAELRAIASVEAQLGEPLREEGPILGVEFDLLPPGAFDTPPGPSQHRKHAAVRELPHFESKTSERQEARARRNASHESQQPHKSGGRRKAPSANVSSLNSHSGSRAIQEYQFIPEQPSGRTGSSQMFERSLHSKYYLGSENPFHSLAPSGSFLHSSDALTSALGLQGRLPNGSILPQVESRNSQLFSQSRLDFEGLRPNPFLGFGYEGRFGAHEPSLQPLSLGPLYIGSEKLGMLEVPEQSKLEKKRKIEEARIAKEVEAHEKRIRREIERQEMARRKREEQVRRESEKQDREKRREEERVFRERQREEERIQREQRREFERREKLIQKETQKVERQRQKDEVRKQKEAGKMKAAVERATARRLAKESMELIDDERLELLEAAAMSQGLPSIYLLDGETLQGLDRYRDALKKFPPAFVKMKRPLAAHPWIDSNQNIGNLLMVWRFLTTFADILCLWPFTVDELVQALHDYDSRLLGEIHIALLKTLVKDIEDVAQATASGMVANQYTVSFTGGGHPQLVEAAYAWGFDIIDWHQHLNPLTWPEILRQFALAAGHGPKWKARQKEVDCSREDEEGNEGEDAVSTLRSGAAVANAVALMRGKGGGFLRRCRHRLTPGTVKYAAFYVLSVEGPGGLTILEVADRIQKSGLRDLTTSKTPEASIAAALSRDTKIFERVAPSTYCVRAPFRKDSEDAEAILQAARDRIRLFQNGLTDAEDAEKDVEDADADVDADADADADEVEREESLEEDVDDVEVDEVEGTLNGREANCCSKEEKVMQAGGGPQRERRLQTQESTQSAHLFWDGSNVCGNMPGHLIDAANGSKFDEGGREGSISSEEGSKGIPLLEETEIDESHIGEPWVQGLMEGEYSDLSVEERLNALVALVEMVNEGNTARVALEERLEAANALKRQLWAEAQLDRRRFREEQLLKSQQSGEEVKTEGSNSGAEGNQSTLLTDEKNVIEGTKPFTECTLETQAAEATPPGNVSIALEKAPISQGGLNQENPMVTAVGFATDKSRAQLKADIGVRAEELYVYRSLPVGSDRRHNRYWQFVTCHGGQDPGCGRLYFESSEDGHWEVIDTEEAFDALINSLDIRGIREAHLHGVLQKLESFLKQGMGNTNLGNTDQHKFGNTGKKLRSAHSMDSQIPRSQVSEACYASEEGSFGDGMVVPSYDASGEVGAIPVELSNNQEEREHALQRYNDFDRWLWSKHMNGIIGLNAFKFGKKRSPDLVGNCEICRELFWPREKHCPSCHATFEASPKAEAKFAQHLSDCEERSKRKDSNWKSQGPSRLLPSRIQLLKAQLLAIEVVIPAEALKVTWTETRRKSWASKLKNAASSGELLQILVDLEGAIRRDWLSSSFEAAEDVLKSVSSGANVVVDNSSGSSVLPWVPQTSAAVALRLMVFDASLFYTMEHKQQSLNQPDINHVVKTVDGALATRKIREVESDDQVCSEEEQKVVDVRADHSNGQQSIRGRGRGGRPRGRGRGRGGTTRSVTAVNDSVPKGSKRKLQFSGEAPRDSSRIVGKSGRRRVRGSGSSGRATGRGRGQSSRSGRGRRNDVQKRRGNRDAATTRRRRRIPEQVIEQEEVVQSDADGSQNVEQWEVGEDSDEGQNREDEFSEEDEEEAADGIEEEEDEPDQEEEQVVEYEYEEDNEGQYEGDTARDSDDSEDLEANSGSPAAAGEDGEDEEEEEDDDDDDDGREGSLSESSEESD